jgi:hypothetical protein
VHYNAAGIYYEHQGSKCHLRASRAPLRLLNRGRIGRVKFGRAHKIDGEMLESLCTNPGFVVR